MKDIHWSFAVSRYSIANQVNTMQEHSKELNCLNKLFYSPRWLFFEGEKWKNARLEGFSHQHILQPMDFTLQLAKCMVDKDSRMPRLAFALYRMTLLFLTHALISVPFQVQSIRGAAVTSCEDL